MAGHLDHRDAGSQTHGVKPLDYSHPALDAGDYAFIPGTQVGQALRLTHAASILPCFVRAPARRPEVPMLKYQISEAPPLNFFASSMGDRNTVCWPLCAGSDRGDMKGRQQYA
jgi:hypothetical protein